MFKKIKNVTLLLVCALALTVPSVSSLAANIEPRVQYAYCSECDYLGLVMNKKETTDAVWVGTIGCDECGGLVNVYYYTIRYYLNCTNCGADFCEEDYVYFNDCGH